MAAPVVLISPFNGGTITVPSDYPRLGELIAMGFVTVDPPKVPKGKPRGA